MYKKKTYKLGSTIEVEEYHTSQARAPGMPREKKQALTLEKVERINHQNKVKLTRRRLRMYFSEGDYFTTLTYAVDKRPGGMEEAKEHWKKFIRTLKRAYEKAGTPMRWMRNIEVGTRGAWHIHMIINRIPDIDLLISRAWKGGKAISQLLYERGGFADLAAYICKTPKTDPRLKESSYSCSRNMPIPEPKVKKIKQKSFLGKRIKVPEGWHLEEMIEGVNAVTGYPYRYYAISRDKERQRRCMT